MPKHDAPISDLYFPSLTPSVVIKMLKSDSHRALADWLCSNEAPHSSTVNNAVKDAQMLSQAYLEAAYYDASKEDTGSATIAAPPAFLSLGGSRRAKP